MLLPDVILLDINMPGMDGIECTRLVKKQYPLVKVIILTMYRQDRYVFEAIKAAVEGTFDSTAYVGTLENDGSYLAPFHEFDSKIPAEVKSEIEQLKADIISGKVTVATS